jgi:hypothetical protein
LPGLVDLLDGGLADVEKPGIETATNKKPQPRKTPGAPKEFETILANRWGSIGTKPG